MTVSTQTRSIRHIGNGSATSFAYDFRIPSAAEAKVVVETISTGVRAALSTSQYSITGIGDAGGGTVNYPLSGAAIGSDKALIIYREVEYTQDMDVTNQGGFFPDVLEEQLDDIVFQVQQIADAQERSLRAPVGDSSVDFALDAAAARAGKTLTFDADGNPSLGPSSIVSLPAGYDTVADVQGATIDASVPWLTTAGYGAVGDGGNGLYDRVLTEPTHQGKIQSADGAWWELVPHPRGISAAAFGMSPSASAATNAAALKNGHAYIIAKDCPLLLPGGDFDLDITAVGLINGGTVIGAGHSSATFSGASVTTFRCYGTGSPAPWAFDCNSMDTVGGFALISQEAGQNGFKLRGGTGSKLLPIVCKDFDGIGWRLGESGVSGCYFTDVDYVECNNQTRAGSAGIVVEGLVLPASNSNIIRNHFVSGRWDTLVQLKGNANTLLGGSTSANNSTSPTSVYYDFLGHGNVVHNPYIEPTGATDPALLIQFRSGANSNIIKDAYVTTVRGNVDSLISDSGIGNDAQLRSNGPNFAMHSVNESYVNLVPNSRWQIWDDARGLPDGWVHGFTLAAISRDTATVHAGPYSIKMDVTSDRAQLHCYLATATPGTHLPRGPLHIKALRDKTVTAIVPCLTTVAGMGGLKINSDAGGAVGNSYHTGSGNWELLVVQAKIPAGALNVSINLRSHPDNTATTGVVYFGEPMLVLGNSIPSYAPARPLTDDIAYMMGKFIENQPLVFGDGDATPSVKYGNVFRTANTAATTITNFDEGDVPQRITIFCEDANTTVAHNTNITTTTGANKALTNGQVYEFHFNGTKWVEK